MVALDLTHASIRLEEHSSARNKAVASSSIVAGKVVLTVPALSTALLQTEKGRRCDYCHRLASDAVQLRKCTGCASYLYCGKECQSAQWIAHHKRICKHYSRFMASREYQTLSSHDQVDAVLLSHLLAEAYRNGQYTPTSGEDRDGALGIFMDLMRGPLAHVASLPVSLDQRVTDSLQAVVAKDYHSRFGNNNFVVHSHLNSYAHGIFPLASRLFNHSCAPNAVTKYIITPSKPVRMEVIALRDIAEDEEVTIPYLDPALPVETRQQALQSNYGFSCSCPTCCIVERVHPMPPPRQGSTEMDDLESALRRYALSDAGRVAELREDSVLLQEMPVELAPVLHESYLPQLSETFSRTSHEGPYTEALSTGLTLLALYSLVYPANYPQIGMHALELAKTAWNAVMMYPEPAAANPLESDAKSYLLIATHVLNIYGEEGDEGGPLAEIRVMRDMLGQP
ncbi:SET domain-containing protein [Fomitopsis serialis]|uniref:SET domain-containing protein n=1 Tax=Fomitopsis serialis TaxID=139415 RepID=UPI00200868D8|nr:SET domain-containing protein [Neoantrodia serialis]KAH9936369.1 SET domain-containing protein [Neoantrodia serialis]